MEKIKNEILKYKGLSILCQRKRVKQLRLKIELDASLVFSIPLHTKKESILAFLDKNYENIKSIKHKIKPVDLSIIKLFSLSFKLSKIKPSSPVFEESFSKTAQEQKGLKKAIVNKNAYFVEDTLYYKDKIALKDFCKSLLLQRIRPFIAHYEKLLNVNCEKITIKKMKTRWGSCNHVKKYINLNLALVHLEPKLVEYVLLHELCHLLRADHSNFFYSLLEKYMKDYKKRELALKNEKNALLFFSIIE